ncbi:MAG: hypothetical protein QOF60_1872 [Actinomycetota bacterium]|jgi:predicted phosphodiesterase|nr:hypothetical protein [Actinomycetota bacterium]
MRLGLVSDIHGNGIALDAVLADGKEQGVDEWWALGDLVAIGVEPATVLERLTNLDKPVRFVRGNTDRYVVNTGDRPPPFADDARADPTLVELHATIHASFSWTAAYLEGRDRGWRQWLADLPDEQRTQLPDGTRVLGVHASPKSDDGPGINPYIPAAVLDPLLDGSDADLVVAGHTHVPTDRTACDGRIRAVNLGSVSNPITPDLRACYVVIDADEHGHRVQHRRVAYDHDAVLARIAASSHPAADYISSFQRGDHVMFESDL